MKDYSITWKYIVSKMSEKYGIDVDNTDKVAFGDIAHKLSSIWDEYYRTITSDEE